MVLKVSTFYSSALSVPFEKEIHLIIKIFMIYFIVLTASSLRKRIANLSRFSKAVLK